MDTPKTLQAAIEFFADEDRCHAYIVQTRWPDGNVRCPTCGADGPRWLANQRRFECRNKHSRRQFSVKVGTIFEDSPIPLRSWLLAVWQITNCKNGISSYELARAIDVTQKTAWFMNHRIRLAMQGDDGGMLGGEVEIDETYIGGKARNMHAKKRKQLAVKRGRSVAGKTAVMGLLQRHTGDKLSRVRTTMLKNVRKPEFTALVSKHVEDGAKVYTDSFSSYDNLSVYYQHQVIDHAEKYVDGQVHTNGCENYWSLLKRALTGTYISVEPFHLFRYLDEQSFRFNERGLSDAERFAMTLRHVTGRRIQYEQLIGRPHDL